MRTKRDSIFITFLILVSSFFGILSFSGPAAAAPTLNHLANAAMTVSASSFTITALSTLQGKSAAFLTIACHPNTGGPILSVVPNSGSNWVQAVADTSTGGSNSGFFQAIWWTSSIGAAITQIVITFTASTSGCSAEISYMQPGLTVTQLNGASWGHFQQNSNNGAHTMTSDALSSPADSIIFWGAGIDSSAGSGCSALPVQTWTAPLVMLTSSNSCGTNLDESISVGWNYFSSSTGATTYSASYIDSNPGSIDLLVDTVAIFGTAATSQVIVVIGTCTFFQLQCWWYPLFFMGLYSGFLLMIGTWLKTSPRGKSHIFLSAVTFGSLVAVIFGIMNIVFPLLMLVLNTIIALRLKGSN